MYILIKHKNKYGLQVLHKPGSRFGKVIDLYKSLCNGSYCISVENILM